MKGFRYLENVTTLEFFEEKCIGCGLCEQVCPHNIFVVDGKRAKIVDKNACIECGACALNCPVKAIAVESGVGCAAGMINEWLMEKGWKKETGSGC